MDNSNTFINAFMPSKFTKLSEGHMSQEQLVDKIRKGINGSGYRLAFNLESRDSVKGYKGVVSLVGNIITFDFDGSSALDDVRNFTNDICKGACRVWYSGSKGFHVDVPLTGSYFGPSIDLPRKLKWVASKLKKSYESLDLSVFQSNRKLRIEGSRHEKTGLYKTPISLNQLETMSLDEIKLICKDPPDLSNFIFEIPGDLSDEFEIYLVGYDDVTSKRFVIDGDELDFYDSLSTKKCIVSLLLRVIPNGERNEVALRIVSDFKNYGAPKLEALKKMKKWSQRNAHGDESFVEEIESMVDRIFDEDERYTFGCHDHFKHAHCSSKCEVFNRLHPDFRPRVSGDTEKKSKPNESEVVQTIIARYKDRIGHYGEALFIKENNIFQEVEINRKHQIQMEMQEIYRNTANTSQLESCLKQLIIASPVFQKNPFDQEVDCVAVENGILTFRGSNGFNLEPFSNDRPVFSSLPIAWEQEPKINEKFEAYLESLFLDDRDSKEKRLAVQQLFGACLFPNWPHLYMFYGPAQTGKSTLLKLLMKFMNPNNVCSIEPNNLEGFMLEAAIGKKVNIVTDIEFNQPMNESVLKRIEDKVPQLINRKNRPAVHATLPLIHVFAGNEMPRIKDTFSGAHKRRWTLIELKNRVPDSDRKRDFIDEIWEDGASYILKFATEGALSLFNSKGVFLNPYSSEAAVQNWLGDSMIVSKFIEDMRDCDPEHGVNGIILDPSSTVRKRELYNAFKEWAKDSSLRIFINENQLRRQFVALGFEEKRDAKAHYFVGFKSLLHF